MTTTAAVSEPGTTTGHTRRVRVWFGPNLIGEYAATAQRARAYAEAMPYRYHGLRITITDLETERRLEPLPTERLWPLTVQ